MSRPSRIAIVKELGSRSPRCLAAHVARGQDEPELVIVERYPAVLGPEVLAQLEEEAKELVTFEQANVATVIASVKLKGDVAILSEWVDGESLASSLSNDQKPSLEILLRVLGDVCDAVTALHMQNGRVCGALGAEDVFVGVDGVTRITRFCLGKIPPDALGARRLASMSPEFLRGEKSPRGDVFTLGTLAWECFSGAQLFETPTSIDAQLAKLGENPPRVDVASRPDWAKPLADVIARALSIFDVGPSARYATPAEFSAAISAAAPGKIASRATVSQWVARVFGERIEARLVKYEPKVDVTFGSVSAPPMSVAPVEPPAPAKLPEIEAPKVEAPKVEVPKVEAPKVEPPPKVEPSKDVAKVEAKAKSPLASPVRKPMPSTPEPAKKIVPLPKRAAADPDSSPSVIAAAKIAPATATKTNGTTPAAKTKADKVVVANVPPPKPPVVPVSDFDSDIDLVSVRPPPIARKEEKLEPSPTPPPNLSPSPSPSPVSVSVSAPVSAPASVSDSDSGSVGECHRYARLRARDSAAAADGAHQCARQRDQRLRETKRVPRTAFGVRRNFTRGGRVRARTLHGA